MIECFDYFSRQVIQNWRSVSLEGGKIEWKVKVEVNAYQL